MCIENWSDNVIVVNFSDGAEVGEELAEVAGQVCQQCDRDVVVDCSDLDRMDCASRRWLLELSDALTARGHRVVLCGQKARLKKTIRAPALVPAMDFASDRFTALAGLGLL